MTVEKFFLVSLCRFKDGDAHGKNGIVGVSSGEVGSGLSGEVLTIAENLAMRVG
jgi:hypothetical protein